MSFISTTGYDILKYIYIYIYISYHIPSIKCTIRKFTLNTKLENRLKYVFCEVLNYMCTHIFLYKLCVVKFDVYLIEE